MNIDAYSEFMFQVGVERSNELHSVLKQIERLLSNTDFNKQGGRPFNLVMSVYEEYRIEIEKLIEPHGGTMVVDAAYITRELGEAIERFWATVAKRNM